MPLDQLDKQIEALGHLPGMPTEEEVKEKGASVGETQRKLLEKIEELTLYVVAQDKRIDRLEYENRALRSGRVSQ
jgi:hypothetical protein